VYLAFFLTKKGIESRELSKNVVLRFNQKIKDRISPKKLETFMEVMQSINQLVETEEIFETKHLAS
jgi:hypothetical protein